MNNRIFPLMFAVAIGCIFLGCSQTNTSVLSQTSDVTQDDKSEDIEQHTTAELTWLHYADPRADANLAIEKQDFTLLAFAGRVTSFPGIDGGSSLLQQQCSYRLLSNSSDVLKSEKELTLRKKLYQYAATYNQLVLAACQKSNQ